MNDRGIAALAYNVLLRPGVKLGFGLSVDTQNLKENAHKVGMPRSICTNSLLILGRLALALNLRDECNSERTISEPLYERSHELDIAVLMHRSSPMFIESGVGCEYSLYIS